MDTNDSCRQIKQNCSEMLKENSDKKCTRTLQTVLGRSDIANEASIIVKGSCIQALKNDGVATELVKTFCQKSCSSCGEYLI